MKNMKKSFLLFLLGTLFMASAFTQSRPLRGSGKLVTREFAVKGFDKIRLADLNGDILVEVGQPFAVSVTIDDNLEELLDVAVENGKLIVKLKKNERNRMYIENTGIKIRISLPEISVLEHEGNTDLFVKGIVGRYFRLQQSGNGDVELSGSIDQADIVHSGNGDIEASRFLIKAAELKKDGNGDATVNVAETLKVAASGNGDVTNKGKALYTVVSKTGNGDLK